ncbi:hypothetical protein D3C76_1450230 [compost metagenome]
MLLERDAVGQVVGGVDRLDVVVLGGRFAGQQVELVELSFDRSCGLTLDPQGFNTHILVTANVSIEVVRAIVEPIQRKTKAEEIRLL